MSCYRYEDVWYILDRHRIECDGSRCSGCQTCPDRHCRVCNVEHVTVDGRGTDLTCSPCLTAARENLTEIREQAGRMLGEAIRLGLINAQAAVLAGPTADPETWNYRRMSALGGRIDPAWLTDQDGTLDESHPTWTLGTWEHLVRLHLDQLRDPGTRSTLTEARDYLDTHLTRLAHEAGFPFEKMHASLRRCRNHLASVLGESDADRTGAPCPVDRTLMVKDYGATPDDDVRWRCPRCGNWMSEKAYRARVEGDYVEHAATLTGSQLNQKYAIPEGTIRSWATRGWVKRRGKDLAGRVLYDVRSVLDAIARSTSPAPG